MFALSFKMSRCINCHLCVDRKQIHDISSLLPSIQTLLATWRSLQQLPPEAVICQECYVILNNHCLNGNMNAERELGHIHVCLGCGRSVLGTQQYVRHHTLEADDPLIAIIVSWNVDNEVLSRSSYVCHQCWMRASQQQSKDVIRDQSLEHDENSKMTEDNLTYTNVKKEVRHPELNEDIQVNAKELLSPITNDQMEYQTNNAHIKIKQEFPCEDSDLDENHSMSKQVYEKLAIPHLLSKTAEDNLTDTNIKKEVCHPEVNKDIQVNDKEQVQIKSEYPKSPITDQQMECQVNDVHTEIKQEFPCEDFDGNQSISKQFYLELTPILQHNTNPEKILTNIDIKKEVCYEEVNEDIQLNANEQLQIKTEHAQSPITDEQIEYQFNNIQDEMMVENKIGNNTTDPYFVNENEKSKLLVPEIKVSNVYAHVLEINPLRCNNFHDELSTPEQDDSVAPKITVPDRATPKKSVKVKTAAERSREYRARKKARQNAANQEPNDSSVTDIQQENSQSDSSQESDGCSRVLLKKRKTPADYSREYRARKKALKELQKKSQESEDDSLKSLIKPNTPAESSHEYRTRKRAHMDLEEPIPIAPIEMVASNNPCTVDQHSILPDAYFITDIPNVTTTSNINNTEAFPDPSIKLHDMLHHTQNDIYNKFPEEILTNIDTKEEVSNTEVNEDIKVNADEHLQVETEYKSGSISEKEESKVLPESTVNNIYDHILDIKQEIPCEYINLDASQSINALNNDTYVQKDLRIKLEENENTSDSRSKPPCAETLPRVNRVRRNKQTSDSSRETASNHTAADQPDEPLTDLPLPSRSSEPTEAPDPEFTYETLFAARKTKAQKQREYRQRIAASRTPAQVIAARKLDAERQRICRLRKADSSALVTGSLEPTTASSSRSGAKSNDVQTDEAQQAQSAWNTKWASSIMRFELTFLDNDFGHACSVCDRLWFKNDLKPITAAQLGVISDWFTKENRRLCSEEYKMVCNICKRTLNKKSMPPLAKVNGFSYPDQPPGLPSLDPISERLISPRLPFTEVRRLHHDISCGITGQVINVPVDVQEMVKRLPRKLNEDDVVNVNIERHLAHKSVYISGYVAKSTISAWLTVLRESPLYRLYKINVDLSRLQPAVPFLDDIQDDPSNRIESISAENTPESEILASRQHTMIWNEEDCLKMASGHQAIPFNVIYDRHAEELSFPSIYFGEPRRFKTGVPITPHMIAASEIRRCDRRGATPQKILYVAMKILRLRIMNGINSTFRNVSITENVTRRMLEDTEFQKEYAVQNLAFMKSVPNSVQYWAARKRDLLAMIRHFGKPTVFLTISANEIRWTKLLTILLKLSKKYPGKTAKDLNTSERCTLVSDDPVTCCIYFYKLVDSLMKMLKSKQSYNPFGKYSVKDYFLRIEFQHQGSPRANVLLWLNDDPRETVSENMPRTIELVEKLSSVARDDVPNNSIYANQIHKHTFTCTKRGETTCRFGIPYWPMPTTRVLVPIPQSDGRRQTLQQKAKELRTSLGERQYACMDEFLDANGLTPDSYLDVVRSTLRRPTLVFRRNFEELMTNTFNPYLAGEVNSNIDIQFILDDYSCAEYVVEFVNKSARGMGNLRRELITMMQEHPDRDYTGQLKALSIKILNAVEMSAQEAAWFLLRQPMSETSRHIVYIPTVWPTERQRCRKRRLQMDREGIDENSTDVWTKNIIQRYEERPASLEQVYLAEFASWYANANDFVDDEDDVHVDDDEDSEAAPEVRTSRAPKEYRRRPLGRVIRYRRYDIDEIVNYIREMVLLYVPFRNEISEIVDQNKFLQLFDDNKDTIMERHSLFETNINIENFMKELEATMILQNDDNSNLQEGESRAALVQRLLGEDGTENVSRILNCEETQQLEDKTAVLRDCKNNQPRTTGDHS